MIGKSQPHPKLFACPQFYQFSLEDTEMRGGAGRQEAQAACLKILACPLFPPKLFACPQFFRGLGLK